MHTRYIETFQFSAGQRTVRPSVSGVILITGGRLFHTNGPATEFMLCTMVLTVAVATVVCFRHKVLLLGCWYTQEPDRLGGVSRPAGDQSGWYSECSPEGSRQVRQHVTHTSAGSSVHVS